MKEFDLEKLERKNIYKVPDDIFSTVQERVMNDVKANKKAPIFKLNWIYAVAASLALIFGITFVLSSDEVTKDSDNSEEIYAQNRQTPKMESEIAYETLKSDLTSVENNNQIAVYQVNEKPVNTQKNEIKNASRRQTVKAVSKKNETRINEYMDSFSNSEIAELANNSPQDVYLDLYN